MTAAEVKAAIDEIEKRESTDRMGLHAKLQGGFFEAMAHIEGWGTFKWGPIRDGRWRPWMEPATPDFEWPAHVRAAWFKLAGELRAWLEGTGPYPAARGWKP